MARDSPVFTMNEKEEKKLIEEYLKSKTKRADNNASPSHTDDATPLPDIPTDLPTSTAGDPGNYIKV